MGSWIWVVVIGTSIWVLFDAKSIGVKKGQINGLGNLGPWGWFVACLLIWIIGFPFYLSKRGEYKRINSQINILPATQTQNSINNIEQLEKLAELKAKGILTEEEFTAKKRDILKIDA